MNTSRMVREHVGNVSLAVRIIACEIVLAENHSHRLRMNKALQNKRRPITIYAIVPCFILASSRRLD